MEDEIRGAPQRVRHAGGNVGRARLWPQQWLLIEWPRDQPEPEKYYLSTLPETHTLSELVQAAHQRWRIERDYQDLKQEFGLAHYEGRGWRGFHHHASLSIAAYAFLLDERLSGHKPGSQKTAFDAKRLPYPKITLRAAGRRAQRHVPDSITTLRISSASCSPHACRVVRAADK